MNIGIDSYEGIFIGIVNGYYITESNIRPKGHRFEASRRDGEPSIFRDSLDDLKAELMGIEIIPTPEVLEETMNLSWKDPKPKLKCFRLLENSTEKRLGFYYDGTIYFRDDIIADPEPYQDAIFGIIFCALQKHYKEEC